MSNIKPAMTPEEWAENRTKGPRPEDPDGDVLSLEVAGYDGPDRQTVGVQYDWGCVQEITNRHGAAALCLLDQPFGFTREILDCMYEWNDYRQTSERRKIAEQGFANLEALLPPEKDGA